MVAEPLYCPPTVRPPVCGTVVSSFAAAPSVGVGDKYTASCQLPAAVALPEFVTVHDTDTDWPGATLAGVKVTSEVARSGNNCTSPKSLPVIEVLSAAI